jgi:hypothetical protein
VLGHRIEAQVRDATLPTAAFDHAHLVDSVALRRVARVVLTVSARETVYAIASSDTALHSTDAVVAAVDEVARVVLAAAATVAFIAVALTLGANSVLAASFRNWIHARIRRSVAQATAIISDCPSFCAHALSSKLLNSALAVATINVVAHVVLTLLTGVPIGALALALRTGAVCAADLLRGEQARVWVCWKLALCRAHCWVAQWRDDQRCVRSLRVLRTIVSPT